MEQRIQGVVDIKDKVGCMIFCKEEEKKGNSTILYTQQSLYSCLKNTKWIVLGQPQVT